MEYQDSPNYLKATVQEKKWFDIYVACRNELTATQAAYAVTSEDSARAMGRKIVKRDHIAALVDEFCTQPNLAPLPTLDDLKRRYIDIANDSVSTPRERLMALNSYERLCGWGKRKEDDTKGAAYDPALDDIQYS